MRKLLVVLGAFGTALAEEKLSLKVSQDLELYGALTGAFFYTTNVQADKFNITNGVIGLKGEAGKGLKVGFDLAVGSLLMPTVWDGGQGDPQRFDFTAKGVATEGFGFVWGYFSLKPSDVLSVDFGVMPTNLGYEVANTYSNPNITLGTTWTAQPVIYPAVRLTFSGPVNLYAEYNQENNLDNFAVGASGELMGIGFSLNYYDYRASRNLVDLVLSYSISHVDLGLNFDYQWLDRPASGSAYGVALYAIPKFGKFSLPFRAEYFNEGTTNIYSDQNAESGYTLTLTPTFRPSENTFLRAEVAYISTENSVFNGRRSKTTLSFEVGFTF